MRFSHVYLDFPGSDLEWIRTGLFSLSTLPAFADFRTVSRFVHTLVGHIDSVNGSGAFMIDPAEGDRPSGRCPSSAAAGSTSETDGVTELRTRGLHDHPDGWLPFDALSVYPTSRAGTVPSAHRDVLSTFGPPCLPMEVG
jgi:hypothetical protein